jgi:hypothetical protein
MKLKFIKSTIITIILSTTSIANAGLIVGNYEYMDLGLTTSKTNAQIDTMILNDAGLNGYAIATDVDAALLYGMLPGPDNRNGQWAALDASTFGMAHLDILQFFMGGHTQAYGRTLALSPQLTMDSQVHGYLRYIDSAFLTAESGHINIALKDGDPVAILDRNWPDSYNILNSDTSTGDYSAASLVNYQSLYKRHVDVPEPTTLAIFTLGLMGLGIRRKNRA